MSACSSDHISFHVMHHFLNLLFPLICLIMLIVAVADCAKSNNEHKPRWIAVIILLPVLGPLLYFQFARGRYVSDL